MQYLEICGKPLGLDGTLVFTCSSGPARFRAHKSLISALRKGLVQAGAFVDLERSCPQLYQQKADGTWAEARLDLVARFPGSLETTMVDVTVWCPHAKGRKKAATVPGSAAQSGEKAKRARYGDSVSPLALESYGRLGDNSRQTLEWLAAWAVAVSASQGMREAALVRRWRLSLEAVLLQEKADLLIQSLGCHGCSWTGVGD